MALKKRKLLALSVVGLMGCSSEKPAGPSYGTYRMLIDCIDQLHELEIREDLIWQHKVTNNSRGPNPESFSESGNFVLSKNGAGYTLVSLKGYSAGYDFMEPRDSTRRVPFEKRDVPPLFFDLSDTGMTLLVADSEYGYWYEKE